jgi:L-ascorbate metabolism protein UlaG (beta-lactamase superfamily)
MKTISQIIAPLRTRRTRTETQGGGDGADTPEVVEHAASEAEQTTVQPHGGDESRTFRRRSLLVGSAAAAATVAGFVAPSWGQPRPAAVPLIRSIASGVQLRWLGNNGWEIRFADVVVLIDPWLTRFKTGTYLPGGADPKTPLVSQPERIDPHVTKADLILLTHGHYDHITDIPYIARRTGATVLGDETHLNLLRAMGAPEEQLSCVSGGEYIQFKGFTVRVLPSLHSLSGPRRKVAFAGTRTLAISPPPKVISDLVEGGTLSYAINVADHFQMVNFGSSNFLEHALAGLQADLVFVQPASEAVPQYLPRLLSTLGHPRFVVPTHWDDFDLPLDEPARDWGGLPGLQAGVASVSPNSKFVMVDHLEGFVP